MNDVIKKRFLEESEVLLKLEMVTLAGGGYDVNDTIQDHVCQTSCTSGCSISCSSGCSKQRAS